MVYNYIILNLRRIHMKLRLLSDLHLEMGKYKIPILPDDKNTVLILAGDVGLFELHHTYVDFIQDVSNRFRHVIYIPGNHEYYRGYFPYSENEAVELMSHIPNLSFGSEIDITIDDIGFVCSTLWSDFEKGDAFSMFHSKNGMNDFHVIRTGPPDQKWKRKLNPEDILKFFNKTVNEFIIPAIEAHQTEDRKVVVITHHAPSERSIAPMYKGGKCNGAFASNLDNIINKYQPAFWLHGHTHTSFDYKIGDTQIVCNPVGYPHERNPEFKPELVLEV